MAIQAGRVLIEQFYTAFGRRDWAAMAAAYHPQAEFVDPVFRLRGWRIGAMWRMLCERGTDLRIEARVEEPPAGGLHAHWEAWYTFRATGRAVHNRIDATFQLQEGRILVHRDEFSLYRWSAQALGAPGWLLGWAPPLRQRIRRQAARSLDHFITDRGLEPGSSNS